jgi:hypothetical protein
MHGPDEVFVHVPHITTAERARPVVGTINGKQEQSWLVAKR